VRFAGVDRRVEIARQNASAAIFRFEEELSRVAEDICFLVAEHVFSAGIPSGNSSLLVDEHDAVVADWVERRLDVGLQDEATDSSVIQPYHLRESPSSHATGPSPAGKSAE